MSARRFLVETTPIRRDREFRLLWIAQTISVMGNQVTRIALPYQVYVLTGSPLSIAALTAVQLLPILIFSLAAGSLADAFDRRKVLMVTQLGLGLSNVLLIITSLQPDPPLWAIYALAGAGASLLAIDWPARWSVVPRLVPVERLPAAIALSQTNLQASQVIGPAFGGAILATVGVVGAYAADLLAFAVAFPALLLLRPIPPLHQTVAPGLSAIREGLAFVASKRVIIAAFAIDLNAMIFGMPTGLFPVLALDVFHTGAAGVGMLAAAPAVGAFVGALTSGWISSARWIGRMVFVAVLAWGISITLFGLSSFSFELALVFLAIAGAADVFSAMLRATIVQVETPDELRGRVSSIHVMSVSSGPRLGDIRATSMAALVGAQASVVVGGVVCLVGAVLTARTFPQLLRHQLRLHGDRADASEAQPAASSGE